MADTSHLEKMGRELKCPICLSLFGSAVSLTCNHVFCNSCIHKSMRSGSNCPVCKVPYQRREIRPAPHMDNLVNIYKSMEVASGLALFVSQNGPMNKLADAEMQANDNLDSRRVTEGTTSETAKVQKTKGVCSTASKVKPKNSGRNRRKSSFATNKRVQVPQSPVTETPARQERDGLGQNQLIKNVMNKCSAFPSDDPLSFEKQNAHLSPFFWVREEERSSQQSDGVQLTLTPAKAPSFSDLKDSDDDLPPEIPLEEEQSKCKADVFDSEMFEWTQRACSPELCSSPFKKKAEDGDDNRMSGQNLDAVIRDASVDSEMLIEQLDVSPQEKNAVFNKELFNNVYPENKSEDNLNVHNIPCNRGDKESNESENICRKNLEAGEAHNGLKTPDTEIPLGSSKAAGTSKTRLVQSLYTKLMNEVENHVAAKSSAASGSKRGTCKNNKLENMKRNFSSVEQKRESVSVKRKKQKKNLAQPHIPIEESNLPNVTVLEPHRVVRKSNSCTTSHDPKENCQLGAVFEQKLSLNGILKEKEVDEGESDNLRRSHEKGKVHHQKNMPALRKCDTVSIKCAFCHSAEETEDSGEMVHYSEGKPVLANHSGGSIIRSHKNCTEWAPNVYFEDDIAVNLGEEITRSRRIKCSLCGVNGAALGCYEKSCRKSFHVPCAKKLRECRWDTDHFVMLCPLHASSKLPCELAISQVREGKCNPKGSHRPRVAVKHNTSINRWDCDRSSEKVVLCCSALAPIEKEAVAELAKSSGAVLSGSWNPTVTHVIASTNEKGECKRTLKVMMGILEGKWILSIKWVQACKEARRLIEETPYEINCDIHGVQNGPRLGRLRRLNEQPKLFSGFNFYFTGDFEPSYKGYLQEIVTSAGGNVLHRKPIAEIHGNGMPSSSAPPAVIVYSIELPATCDLRKKDTILDCRRSDAEVLAISSGAKLVNNSWLLNCVAGHKLQDL